MPEIPDLDLPPAAVHNARQAVRWLGERQHCPLASLCDTCAMLVAEAVALGLLEGGGYQLGRDGCIVPPLRSGVTREVILIKKDGPIVHPVSIADPYG